MNTVARGGYAAYDRTVIGYHGTSAGVAERLVAGEPFLPSEQNDEWLGSGVYFWEHAHRMAWRWAKQQHGPYAAVVGAVIRLGNCLDLLDPVNVDILKGAFAQLEVSYAALGQELPRNVRNNKRLDCTVFNMMYTAADRRDRGFDSCRAVYVPAGGAQRLWRGSTISDSTHIQICLRNQAGIRGVWYAREDGRYGRG